MQKSLVARIALMAPLTVLSACGGSTNTPSKNEASASAAIAAVTRAPRDNQAMTCPEVAAEIIRLEGLNRRAEMFTKRNRSEAETAKFFAALFLVSNEVVDTKAEQAALLNGTKERQDDLHELKREKAC